MNNLEQLIQRIDAQISYADNFSNDPVINAKDRIERTLSYWCRADSFDDLMSSEELSRYIDALSFDQEDSEPVSSYNSNGLSIKTLIDQTSSLKLKSINDYFKAIDEAYHRRLKRLENEDPDLVTLTFKKYCCYPGFAEQMTASEIIDLLKKVAKRHMTEVVEWCEDE